MRGLERYLWLALMTASTAVLLSAAWQPQGLAAPLAWFWWRWLLAFTVGAAAVLFLVAWSLGKLLRRDVHSWVLAAAAAWLGIVALWSNRQAALELVSGASDPDHGTAAALAFILALTTVVALVVGSRGRGWTYRFLSLAALLAFGLWLRPGSPEAISSADLPRIHGSGQRLLLIGIDGADWRYIDPLMERGELPNLQRLVETGIRGPLATIRPTRSPALWTTVVTGKRPADHGVEDHAILRPRNDRHPLPKPRTLARGFAMQRLHRWLRQEGHIINSPATSVERRVPAFWNITTAYDSPLDVVNWWATWPAEPILGRMVSDRVYFWRWSARGYGEVEEALTFPDSLYRQLASRIMRPDEVTLAEARRFLDIDAEEFTSARQQAYQHHEILSEFKYYFSMFETHRRIVAYFFERARAEAVEPSDLMVIYRLPDMLSHSTLRYSELVEDHLDSPAEDVRRFAGAVSEAYRQADRAVGEMVAAFGEGNVLVISDHGFVLEQTKRKGRVYGHNSGPSGIFLAAGPAFARGEVEDLSLFHILPILLAVKGFPVPADIVEEVPERVFDVGFLATHPVSAIDSYGEIDLSRTVSESVVDEEMMQRLEALGYLD